MKDHDFTLLPRRVIQRVGNGRTSFWNVGLHNELIPLDELSLQISPMRLKEVL